MEFFTDSTKPHNSEVFTWMHCRPNDVTTKNVNVLQGIDMKNNQISNLNMDNLRSNLPSFRWLCQTSHNPPLDGEIYVITVLDQPYYTFLMSKKCKLDRTVTNIMNWTSVTITDIDKSIIYECSLSNWQTFNTYFSVRVTVNQTIGTLSTWNGSILEIKYTPPVSATLEGLTDVRLNEPNHNQVLGYDGDQGIWRNITVSGTGDIVTWNSIEDKPTTFPPEAHQHVVADISDFPTTMPINMLLPIFQILTIHTIMMIL